MLKWLGTALLGVAAGAFSWAKWLGIGLCASAPPRECRSPCLPFGLDPDGYDPMLKYTR